MSTRKIRMTELQEAAGHALQTLRRARSAYLGMIAAHEQVARLLVALGDHAGAAAKRQAAQGERTRLARLDARLVLLGDPGPNGS
jgi:hypothetical protein